MPNSHCVTPAAVLVKKFFMILQNDKFSVFFIYLFIYLFIF